MKSDKKTEKNESRTRDKKSPKNFSHEVFFVSVIIMCISLISVVLLLTVQYSDVLEEQVAIKSTQNSAEALNALGERIGNLKQHAVVLTDRLSRYTEQSEYTEQCMQSQADTEFNLSGILRVTGGKVYRADGELLFGADSSKLLADSGTVVWVPGIVYDDYYNLDRFAVAVKTEDSPFTDSLVFLYSLAALSDFKSEVSAESLETSSFFAFCTTDGRILEILGGNEELLSQNTNVIDGLRDLTGRKENSDELRRLLATGSTQVLSVSIGGSPYAVAVVQNASYGNLCFVSISHASEVYSSGYAFLSVIMTAVIIAFSILLIFAIYFIINKINTSRKISQMGTVNEVLECFTHIGFEREVKKNIERYRGSKFAVIVVGVRRFEYIKEAVGDEGANDLLKKIRTTLNSALRLGECLGYDDQGEFLMLLQYKQTDMFMRRLREMYRAVYNAFTTPRYNVKLNFGICMVENNDNPNAERLVAKAKLAMNNCGLEKMGGNYTVYDESIRNNYLQISDVEIKMDYGIRNREFKVFFQPKYNVNRDCIDGCEALVRWYDEKNDNYRVPDSFLPMLEANGFISRLDHYVFLEVCKFVSGCVAKGLPVVPVSVNISRVTALEPDFVDYYVNTKNQYKIPDKFITLELTESVAYENYDLLSSLVQTLRRRGFECSIDDFGVGYSSYDLLKQLEVDEVKLDRFFIEGCLTSQRARYILEGAVTIANNLGVKVTQEGVEDAKTFQYVKSIGCNVIQGFYYSKPLEEKAYLEFLFEHVNKKM